MCVTRNDGYSTAANRGSKNLEIFNLMITFHSSMKRRFLWSGFFAFFFSILRLQIYKAIAAIFLQSASYVLVFHKSRFLRLSPE